MFILSNNSSSAIAFHLKGYFCSNVDGFQENQFHDSRCHADQLDDRLYAAIEATMAHILIAENFQQFKRRAFVMVRQMVTPEHVNAVSAYNML